LPDGFTVLLAPAAALPALLLRPVVAPPVVPVDEPVVVPPMDDPVVDDPDVVPVTPGLAAAPPPAEPTLLWASANVLVRAIAAANPIVASFMIIVLSSCDERTKDGGGRCS
jgi:hypothetical protein